MITDSQIKAALRRAAASPGKKVDLKDGYGRGAGRLLFRARADAAGNASATWSAIYYRHGKPKLAKIDNYPALGLADARKRFREEYAPAISAGAEPKSAATRRRHSGATSSATITELFEGYVANLKRSDARSAGAVKNLLLGAEKDRGARGAAEIIGPNRPASSIQPEDIVLPLKEAYDRGSPATANILRSYMSAAFNFGLTSAYDYRSPGTATDYGLTFNPVERVQRDDDAVKTSDRFLSPTEFRNYWLWLCEKRKTSRIAYGAQVHMATGQRIEEALGMTDTGYDRAMKTHFWPTTKNERPHLIPLPQVAIDILDELAEIICGEFFFPHRDDQNRPAHANSILALIKEYIEETGAEPFVARDIRRTVKTLAGRAGVSKEMRDKLQNHAQRDDVSSKHYDRYDYLAEKTAAMAVWSAFMDRIIAGTVDDDEDGVVVPIVAAK